MLSGVNFITFMTIIAKKINWKNRYAVQYLLSLSLRRSLVILFLAGTLSILTIMMLVITEMTVKKKFLLLVLLKKVGPIFDYEL